MLGIGWRRAAVVLCHSMLRCIVHIVGFCFPLKRTGILFLGNLPFLEPQTERLAILGGYVELEKCFLDDEGFL